MLFKIAICLLIVHLGCCEWVEDWMTPVQEQLKVDSQKEAKGLEEDEKLLDEAAPSETFQSTEHLKAHLENTLANAKTVAETLKVQIEQVMRKEQLLKEAITTGKDGVSTVTVTTMIGWPKNYFIRDGEWSVCTGEIQYPVVHNTQNVLTDISTPRCVGQEIPSSINPCVFNSITKYETVPTKRQTEYIEDDYVCLKGDFNKTMEQYLSVPVHIVNETCTNGVSKSLPEVAEVCGIRMLSEYSYYPSRSPNPASPALPLEYCTAKDGSCKLLAAWHISNTTIENFVYFRHQDNFKKYFIKTGPSIEHII